LWNYGVEKHFSDSSRTSQSGDLTFAIEEHSENDLLIRENATKGGNTSGMFTSRQPPSRLLTRSEQPGNFVVGTIK